MIYHLRWLSRTRFVKNQVLRYKVLLSLLTECCHKIYLLPMQGISSFTFKMDAQRHMNTFGYILDILLIVDAVISPTTFAHIKKVNGHACWGLPPKQWGLPLEIPVDGTWHARKVPNLSTQERWQVETSQFEPGVSWHWFFAQPKTS